MDRQTLRDWVIRYNAHGPDGLYDCWSDGRPPRLAPHEEAELMRIVLAGPDPEADGLSAFTREDLVRICETRFDRASNPAHRESGHMFCRKDKTDSSLLVPKPV